MGLFLVEENKQLSNRTLKTTSLFFSFFFLKDAVAIARDISDAEVASRKLVQEAYARGSCDNITCIVVRFEVS